MTKPVLQAVLFDAHGTLLQVREPVGETYARFAREQGVDLPAWRIGDAFQRILGRMPERFFPDATPEAVRDAERAWWRQVLRGTFRATDQTIHFPDFEALFDAVYRYFGRADAWKLCAGASDALAELRAAGLCIGIASNFDERLPNLLAGLDILRFFDFIAIPSTVAHRKPDAAFFEAALRGLEVPATAAAYVGDDAPGDLDGARAAGLLAIDATRLDSLADLPASIRAAATLPSPAAPSGRPTLLEPTS